MPSSTRTVIAFAAWIMSRTAASGPGWVTRQLRPATAAASDARVVAATAMLRLRIVPTPKRVMRLPWALRNSGASGWVPSAR